MRKYILFSIIFSVCIMSCKEKTNNENVVGPVAEQYYKYLLEGNYESFVDGTWHEDSIRASYRQELISNAKMYMAQMKEQHQGIKKIELKSVDNDTVHHEANVFFMFTFGDNTIEQIVVPMVEREGVWYMR